MLGPVLVATALAGCAAGVDPPRVVRIDAGVDVAPVVRVDAGVAMRPVVRLDASVNPALDAALEAAVAMPVFEDASAEPKFTDPCESTQLCDPHATCTYVSVLESVTCTCNEGYVGDGQECFALACDPQNPVACAAGKADCVDTGKGTECRCHKGYAGDGTVCVDVDECAENTDNCHADASCTNTEGSFTCACKDNFEGTGIKCRDIDECARGTSGCDLDRAVCENVLGAPARCVDINECDVPHVCGPGMCTNSLDGFSCRCPYGLTGLTCNIATSCVGILRAGLSTGSGMYDIAPQGPDGSQGRVRVYCDMEYEGGGWILVVTSNAGPQSIGPGVPAPGQYAYLPVDVMKLIAYDSDTIHIRTSGHPEDSVTSFKNTRPIQNLKDGNALYTTYAEAIAHTDWKGPRSPNMTLNGEPIDPVYPRTIYHASGNEGGLHWIGGLSEWTFQGPNVPLELYVRKDPCPTCKPGTHCARTANKFACVAN
ncbi:MAG: EGF domain-containing protein [Myxococcales bacterium]